jgi:L-lactate dehydrogenase complex protein LldF
MSEVATSSKFKENAHDALTDARLQGAMSFSRNFVGRRAAAAARLPEFEALRDSARAIKDHTLAHIDLYLEAYEQKVRASGGEVHYAQDAEEARKIIIDLCKSMGAKSVTKGKSMIAEEINLNHALEGAGIEPIETDLGEYIIQLRGEGPSHIIAPAIHLTAKDIEQEFRKAHGDLLPERSLAEPEQLLAEARQVLRAKFLAADVGITGANFLVAETGTSIIVTNEGNGDLTQILPQAHIVIASLEKIVPTLEDAAQLLRVLARSATGQDASVYTTLSTGPRRPGDPDGPRAYHVVILDNGRSTMLGGEFEDMLRCIRCGACMNHCPVYQAVGGHAYGWVYPGPMGAVLTPSLIGVAEGGQLPNASTFCGRCEEVCPVRIPLPGMMRHWREREFERRLSPAPMRYGLGFWAFFASRPALYRMATGLAARAMHLAGRNKGRFASLPFAGGWTRYRDLAAPQGAAVFASIRRSLGVTGDEATRRFEVETRLKQAPAGIVPKRGQGDVSARVETFKAEAERAQASVTEVREWADAPGEIARYLRESNCPATLRMGDDPRLTDMPWSETTLEVLRGPSDGHDLNAVSAAFAGIAETGTLALVSGPDNPTTLNFLPDNHIVVLPREAIEADYESVFAKVRTVYGKGEAPRTLNFITGPSRSADIEQTLLLGAHGPRRLHIVVVG